MGKWFSLYSVYLLFVSVLLIVGAIQYYQGNILGGLYSIILIVACNSTFMVIQLNNKNRG